MKRASTLPFFQVDSGQMLASSMGRTHEEMGLFLMLMVMYWENDCRLPHRERLAEALQVRGKKLATLDKVIAIFFPGGVNEQLDLCKANALKTSQRQSANARKRYADSGQSKEISGNLQGRDLGAADF